MATDRREVRFGFELQFINFSVPCGQGSFVSAVCSKFRGIVGAQQIFIGWMDKEEEEGG